MSAVPADPQFRAVQPPEPTAAATSVLPSILTVQIAPAWGSADITRSYLQKDGRLYNEDIVLQLQLGGDLRQYKDLLRDDHVKSTFDQRRAAITAAEWSVEPGDTTKGGSEVMAKTAADFLKENLDRIGFDDVTDRSLYARFYGYSVTEILWDVIDGKQQWSQFRIRDRARFFSTPEGRFFLNNGAPDDGSRIWCDGTLQDPYFWILSSGDDYSDNPYGQGLAHQLYWIVRFKRDVIRWWMLYNEKYAQPTTVGTFKPGTTDADKTALLAALGAVLTEGGVIVPEGMTITLLEAQRSGSSDYAAFLQFCDDAISKLVVGQTLTTSVGKNGGNRALGQVHASVKAELIKSDGDLICESLNNGPVRWLITRNFGPNCPMPKIKRKTQEEADLTALSTQLVNLDAMGFRPTLEFVETMWNAQFTDTPPPDPLELAKQTAAAGLGPPAPGQVQPPKKPTVPEKTKGGAQAGGSSFTSLDFAAIMPKLFPDQAAIDGALDMTATRMASLGSDVITPVLDYAAEHSPAEMLAALQHGLPQWPDQTIRTALAQFLFVAKVTGNAYARAA